MILTPGQTILIAVRHSESEANVDHTFYQRKPSHEIELTKNGHLQSTAIGKKIANYVENIELDYDIARPWLTYWSSPYRRALQTIQDIKSQISPEEEVHEDILCSEQTWGDAEGTSGYDEYIQNLPMSISRHERRLRYKMGHLWYTPTRGENLVDVYQRVGLFLEKCEWFKHHRIAILASHKVFLTMLHFYLIGGMPSSEDLAIHSGWQNGEARAYLITHEPRKVSCDEKWQLPRDLDT